MGVRLGFQIPVIATHDGAVWGDEVMAMGLARALGDAGSFASAEVYDPVLVHDNLDVQVDLYPVPVVRRTSVPRRIWWVQARVDEDWARCPDFSAILGYYHGFFAASPVLARKLAAWGAPPERIALLPMSCDTKAFRPVAARPELACSVAFCGNGGIRTRREVAEYLFPLRAHGLAIWGSDWDAFPELAPHVRGPLHPALVPALYASAGVVVSVHSPWHRDNDVPTSRLAEALSCGAALVSDSMPFARERYGDAVAFCDDGAAMERAVAALLADAGARERLAGRGRELMETRLGFQAMARDLLPLLAGAQEIRP